MSGTMRWIFGAKYLVFDKIAKYFDTISDIKEDTTIPKYATNLVYVSRAKTTADIY